MAYRLILHKDLFTGIPTITAAEYSQPGQFTRRSSSGMNRWMSRQLEREARGIQIPKVSFVQWLKLLKHKSLIVDKL